MSLSKVNGSVPSSSQSRATTSEVVEFLREFKPLECGCCNGILGFQHRVTGVLLCNPDCLDQHQGRETALRQPSYPSSHVEAQDVVDDTNNVTSGTKLLAPHFTKMPTFVKPTAQAARVDNPIAPDPKLAKTVAEIMTNVVPRLNEPKLVENPASKPWMYNECQFSQNLDDNARVKISFVYNINKMQVGADADVSTLLLLHEKISEIFQTKNETKLTRAPIVDEIVLADYGGEYYRARVMKGAAEGEPLRLMFVDFGDYKNFTEDTEIYAVNDELKQFPILSICVYLDGVKRVTRKVRGSKALNELFYSELRLKYVEKLILGEHESYRAVLWLSEDKSLNEEVSLYLSKDEEKKAAKQ